MGSIVRGWRNVFRNKTRSLMVIVVLAVSVGVTITMVQVSRDIRANLQILTSDYMTLIEVRKAGATGMGVGVAALPEQFFERANALDGIVSVEKYLFQRLRNPDNGNMISLLVGVGPGAAPRLALHGELNNPRVIAGRGLTPEDAGRPVAVVGQGYANSLGLSVGDQFTLAAANAIVEDRRSNQAAIKDVTVTVIGLFESGFSFGDNQLLMPLDVVQTFADQPGSISHIYVRAKTAQGVADLEENLWNVFNGEADVISGKYLAAKWGETLRGLETQSLIAAGIAAAAGALVVLLIMVLVTHERTREIGTMKAIGGTNYDVGLQFAAEAFGIATVGGVLGAVFFLGAGSRVANIVLGVAGSSNLAPATAMGGQTPGKGLVFNFELSLPLISAVVALVMLMALVGSITSVIRAVRLRPVDAMRMAG